MDNPKYYTSNEHRHLVMTYDWFVSNLNIIHRLLEDYGFNDEQIVNRIEDEEQNYVEFMQPLENYDETDEEILLKVIPYSELDDLH